MSQTFHAELDELEAVYRVLRAALRSAAGDEDAARAANEQCAQNRLRWDRLLIEHAEVVEDDDDLRSKLLLAVLHLSAFGSFADGDVERLVALSLDPSFVKHRDACLAAIDEIRGRQPPAVLHALVPKIPCRVRYEADEQRFDHPAEAVVWIMRWERAHGRPHPSIITLDEESYGSDP